jgi:hypothetical protein
LNQFSDFEIIRIKEKEKPILKIKKIDLKDLDIRIIRANSHCLANCPSGVSRIGSSRAKFSKISKEDIKL